MSVHDRSQELLLELGNPAERRPRVEQIDRALRAALTLMDADAVAIVTRNTRHTERLVLHAGSAVPAAIAPGEGSEVLRRLAESCVPIVLNDLTEDGRIATADGCPGVEAGPTSFTPLRQRTLVSGYIAVYRKRGRARFTMTDSRILLLLSAWLAGALENLRLGKGAEKLAIRDELTEVYNYRFLQTALRREVRRASRFGQELSLLLIDMDDLSDEAMAGNPDEGKLLKQVATVLSRQARSFDLLARCAEDAFMLILPQAGRDGATEVAERLRKAVECHAFETTTAEPVTVSLGVATFPHDALSIDDLVAACDRALRQAKQQGRNRVALPSRAA